jgi:glutathione-regulated potassium-efflux system ancillary protein KefF
MRRFGTLRYVSGMAETPDTAPAAPQPNGIYLIAAHPSWRDSRVNQKLMTAARALAAEGATLPLVIQDLYASYPDYFIDVPCEQARMDAARLIVLMHPIEWYSMPALQKLWLDEVLTYGWAYGAASAEVGSQEQPPAGTPGTALRGKHLWLVATTGGPEDSYSASSYNRYSFDAFLPPYEQTAALCGMHFLPPLILHGAHSVGKAEMLAHVELFRERLKTYPRWANTAEPASLQDAADAAESAPPASSPTAAAMASES